MKLLVLILARKNSKRLKNKNIILINNKPLIQHSIDFAKKIVKNKAILVFTDDERILRIAKKNKLKTYIERPKNLSRSSTSSATTALYAIKKFEEKYEKIETLLLLQPTTPYRNINSFNRYYENFKKKKEIPLISVAKIKKNISVEIDNYCKKKIDQQVRDKFLKKIINFNDKNFYYFVNGAFYFISVNQLKLKKKFYFNKVQLSYSSFIKECLDIDTKKDYKISKKILNAK